MFIGGGALGKSPRVDAVGDDCNFPRLDVCFMDEPVAYADAGGMDEIAEIGQKTVAAFKGNVGKMNRVQDRHAHFSAAGNEGGAAIVGVDQIDGMLGQITTQVAA